MGSIRAAFLSALGFASASQLAGAASAQQFEVPASAKAAIVEQTNAYRAEKGLPPLSENAEASREAQAYANTWRRLPDKGTARTGGARSTACAQAPPNSVSSAARTGTSRGRGQRRRRRRPRWRLPCASGSIRRDMSARFGRHRPRLASAWPAGGMATSGTTRRSKSSSIPPA